MTRKSKKVTDAPAVQFDPKLMEALVPGPLTPAEANALIRGFKKALFERALGAELTHHLGYGKDEPPSGRADQPPQRHQRQDGCHRHRRGRRGGAARSGRQLRAAVHRQA